MVILSAGGSSYYDLVASIFATAGLRTPTSIVLRSGCYLTHDAGLYQREFLQIQQRSEVAAGLSGGLENALELWAYVISRPERRRIILGSGRRDFGHDAGPPVLLKHFRPGRDREPAAAVAGCEIIAINDQHAHLIVPEDTDLRVGDLVALGVSHPCTTFDKWKMLYIVGDDYVVRSAIQTFF
jgi:D-serine dehydratase